MQKTIDLPKTINKHKGNNLISSFIENLNPESNISENDKMFNLPEKRETCTIRLYNKEVVIMDRSTTYSKLRKHLKIEFDRVCEGHEILQVKRRNGASLVLMPEEDYLAMQETLYLARSAKTHKRIMDGLDSSSKQDKNYEDLKKKYSV